MPQLITERRVLGAQVREPSPADESTSSNTYRKDPKTELASTEYGETRFERLTAEAVSRRHMVRFQWKASRALKVAAEHIEAI